MSTLPLVAAGKDCWNRIGVWGDRSCPELASAVHCHNCPVFATAGRQFLDVPSPSGYLEDWAERLAALAPHGDREPFGALLPRVVFVEIRLGRREAKLEDRLAPLRTFQLGILAKVSKQQHFVQAFGHDDSPCDVRVTFDASRLNSLGAPMSTD